jgi:PAS domain S-box-containing protein
MVASAVANVLRNSLLHSQVKNETERYRKKGEQFRRFFQNLPTLAFAVDSEGRIIDFNQIGSKKTGFKKEEIMGRELRLLWSAAKPIANIKEKLRKGGSFTEEEASISKKGGGVINARLSFSSLEESGNSCQGLIAVASEVSPPKQDELDLVQAERLSSIGKVVATVAHELRNQLGGVLGFSQLLLVKNTHPELSLDLERVSTCAERCRKIVNSLLDFSRKSQPERKILGLNGILRKTLDMVEKQYQAAGIDLEIDFDTELPFCLVDFHQMQQVFLNLLRNAQQAILSKKRGGKICIRTRNEGHKVLVEIQDDGPGMSRDIMGRIFDPFFTTKPMGEGTGLGLSMVHGMITSHEGHIEVDSQPGQGATFRIRLPVTDKTPEAEELVEDSQNSTSERRILVVDDDPIMLDLFLEIIWSMGHRGDTAANGHEALEKVKKNDYDLVISDLKMPQMDGIQLFYEVQKLKPKMVEKYLFATGDVTYMNSHEFMLLSERPCLIKPINIDEMQRTIENIFSRTSENRVN